MEPVSVTTHDELRVETNRYIILHVLDAVFVTQKKHYDALIKMYSYKYGEKN
jgi:type II restriction enzyme